MSRRGPKLSGPNFAKLMVVAEKTRYPFSAYPRTRCKDLLFAGCALPSQLPRTTDALARLCRSHGCGVAYDCCGKPLADWGEARAAGRALDRLAGRLRRLDCERLVVACPNCLDHLQGHLAVPCVSVYEALAGWGFSPAVPLPAGVLFSPCPDRRGHRLEGQLRALADLSEIPALDRVPCCGLRADAAARGAGFAAGCARRVFEAAEGRRIYTLCASCSGQFARLGHGGVRHALSAILGVDEEPDCRHALANRARRRFDRDLEPLTAPCNAGAFSPAQQNGGRP